jgi:hypothetical protein
MEDGYRLRMMPLAEEKYYSLRPMDDKLTRSSPRKPPEFLESKHQHFERVQKIIRSLQDPKDVSLDEALLERMSFLRTRSIESTLVYFLRRETPIRIVSILVITECDSTNAYVRFCAFMNAGGHEVLEALGVHIPIGYVGPSAVLQ